MISIRQYLVLMLGFLTLVSCSPNDSKGELLVGDWVLSHASRQGRPTSTLDGLRFTFTTDSVYTNLPVFENHNYTYSRDTLKILSSDPYVFVVSHVDSSELQLVGEIRKVLFRLNFNKNRP